MTTRQPTRQPQDRIRAKTLPIVDIRVDGGTQPRDAKNQECIEDYRDAMREGATFPPVVVFYDGASYWLADGYHRMEACCELAIDKIKAEVHQGTQRDAILYSVGANATHGLPRTNADKRRAVTRLLSDPEWCQWSDRLIAETCAVSHPFVATMRSEVVTVTTSTADHAVEQPATTVGKDGKRYPRARKGTEKAKGKPRPFRPDVVITKLVNVLDNTAADWPEDVSMRELVEAIETYLASLKRRMEELNG